VGAGEDVEPPAQIGEGNPIKRKRKRRGFRKEAPIERGSGRKRKIWSGDCPVGIGKEETSTSKAMA